MMDLGWTIGQATISLLAIVGLADFLKRSEFKEAAVDFLTRVTVKDILTGVLGAVLLYGYLFAAAL